VMDFEEPPLQAEIMMSISMTLSLILSRQRRHWHGTMGVLLAAAALHDEDILVTDRSLCKAVLAGQRRPVGAREATD
jgi:hypothetical protein